jgi:hypothetical protein
MEQQHGQWRQLCRPSGARCWTGWGPALAIHHRTAVRRAAADSPRHVPATATRPSGQPNARQTMRCVLPRQAVRGQLDFRTTAINFCTG